MWQVFSDHITNGSKVICFWGGNPPHPQIFSPFFFSQKLILHTPLGRFILAPVRLRVQGVWSHVLIRSQCEKIEEKEGNKVTKSRKLTKMTTKQFTNGQFLNHSELTQLHTICTTVRCRMTTSWSDLKIDISTFSQFLGGWKCNAGMHFYLNNEGVVHFYFNILEIAQLFPDEVIWNVCTHTGCCKLGFPLCIECFWCF